MKGLTQKDLADAIGVSVQAISKWECGAIPDISQIQPLCIALGTTPNELLGSVEHYEAQNEKWFEIMQTYGDGSLELIKFERKVLKEYPNDELYGFRLAADLQFYAQKCKDKSEAMRYYQASKQQCVKNLKRKPGDEVNLALLVEVCAKLGLKEEALQHALSSSRKNTLLKLVYEDEELVRHNQSLINSLLRSLIMEIMRLDENKIECSKTCQNILRAIFPDGNMQSFYRYMMVSKIHEAGEFVRIGNYDMAMEALWQTLDLVKEEHRHLHQKEFTSPLFDRLDAGRDYEIQ